MPRKVRIEYPGAIYHLMSRGDRREDVFHDDVDRQDCVKTLAEACQKTGWQVHAYCLMRNHFHLVVETPQSNLVAGMRWLLSAYTMRSGSQEFRRRMLDRIAGRMGENHESGIRLEAAESRADGIIAKELARLGWTEAELARRRKGDPAKLALAARLRRETTLTMKWIAARLHLGSVQSARVRVHALTSPTAKG